MDRKINCTSVFILMMPMIFIFGLARKYLQEKKLGHSEKIKMIFFFGFFWSKSENFPKFTEKDVKLLWDFL